MKSEKYLIQLRYKNGAIADAVITKPPTATFWVETLKGHICFEIFFTLLEGGENPRLIKTFYRQCVDEHGDFIL